MHVRLRSRSLLQRPCMDGIDDSSREPRLVSRPASHGRRFLASSKAPGSSQRHLQQRQQASARRQAFRRQRTPLSARSERSPRRTEARWRFGWKIDRPALIGEIRCPLPDRSASSAAATLAACCVSAMTDSAKSLAVALSHIGWYGGAGGGANVHRSRTSTARIGAAGTPLRGITQECKTCKVDTDTLLIECGCETKPEIKGRRRLGQRLLPREAARAEGRHVRLRRLCRARRRLRTRRSSMQASTTFQAYNAWDARHVGAFGVGATSRRRGAQLPRVVRPPNTTISISDPDAGRAGRLFPLGGTIFVRWAESMFEMTYDERRVSPRRQPEGASYSLSLSSFATSTGPNSDVVPSRRRAMRA